MQKDPDQAAARRRQTPLAEPAVDDHGRVVTANEPSAAFYRQAQQAVDSPHAVTALRLAVTADPAFGLAVADLDAITTARPRRIGGRPMNWERHHIEIVRIAAAGNLDQAADLLREHLASVGCDPLATRIVTHLQQRLRQQGGCDDLRRRSRDCHPAWPAMP
jgi:DNA-binding GntR family transcriptional regulator